MLALASMRPLHEALTLEIGRAKSLSLADVFDPLQRYSSSGYLFQRTRRLSAALEGLRRRLERPCPNMDVLIWRLRGPFGPVALAEGLIPSLSKGSGRSKLLVGEIALTLSRVDWADTSSGVSHKVVKERRSTVSCVSYEHWRVRFRRINVSAAMSTGLCGLHGCELATSQGVSLDSGRILSTDARRQQRTAAEILKDSTRNRV